MTLDFRQIILFRNGVVDFVAMMDEIFRGTGRMAKGLTITAMALAVLTLVLCGMDLAISVPFNKQSIFLDIAFVICGLVIGFLGFTTLRELD